jgi:hypothetical protein
LLEQPARLPDQHHPRLAPRSLFDPERHRGKAATRRHHQIGPRRFQGIGTDEVDMIEIRADPRLALTPLWLNEDPLRFAGPSDGAGEILDLRVVAAFLTQQQPDAG